MPPSGLNQRYSRNPDLITANMYGDILMMSIARGDYFGIGGFGTRIWEMLTPQTPDDIAQMICMEFDVDEVHCRADVHSFLDVLKAHNVVSLDVG